MIKMDATEKAWDSAIENSKSLVTLATGVVALSITFLKADSGMATSSIWGKTILVIAWIMLLASAGIGVLWTQNGFISVLAPKSPKATYVANPRNIKIRVPYNWQSGFFLAGIALHILYGVLIVYCILPQT